MFVELFNVSISASWLILTIVAVRLLFKKMPKALRCALWALVAIRLICPFSIQSALSLLPSAETVPEEALYMQGTEPFHSIPVEVVSNPLFGEITDVQLNTTVGQVQHFDVYGTLTWAIGLGVILLYGLVSYLRLRRKVLVSINLKDNIWICDAIGTPFILGVIRPRIYLPSALEEDKFSAVIAHEQAHLRRKDHWWKPLGFMLLAVYWFNPVIWVAYILLCRDIELACDEKVIREMEPQDKKAYSEALLACSIPFRPLAGCPLFFGEGGVKARIRSILHYKKPAVWVTAAAVVTGIALAVCFLTDPKEGAGNDLKLDSATPETLREVPAMIYALEGVTRNTAFYINFELPCTYVEVSCSDGLLRDLAEEKSAMRTQLQTPGAIGWVPMSGDTEDFVESAKITFTAYSDEEAMYTGTVLIIRSGTGVSTANYEISLVDAPGLIMKRQEGNFNATIMLDDFSEEHCSHVPGTYLSTEWKDAPNPDSEQYETFELRWDTYTCKNCGKTFANNTGIYREKQSGTIIQNTGWQLDAEDFEEPVAAAEKILSRAFSYNGDGYTDQVSQNGDFWNITFNGEYTYVVELSEELPYPQTIYQFRRVPPGGNDAMQLPPEGEFVTIAQEFLFNAYGLDGDQAEASVFVCEDKVCVQFVMSETEIFQVRIHTGDLLPSGILFFNNLGTAQQCLEEAGAVGV